jgi:hypothetical protein
MGKPSAPAVSTADFGACSNPGITYDASHYHHFMPSNTDQFPLDATSDIASLESEICLRLEYDECDASSDAVGACHRARWRFSGYVGQEAADAWNQALGVDRYVGCGLLAAGLKFSWFEIGVSFFF